MSTLLEGRNSITPWIEDAAFHAATFEHNNNAKKGKVEGSNYVITIGGRKVSVSRRPKLVQILESGGFGNNDGDEKLRTTRSSSSVSSSSLSSSRKRSRGISVNGPPPYILVHDGKNFVTAVLSVDDNDDNNKNKEGNDCMRNIFSKGSLVRIKSWTVSTIHECCNGRRLSRINAARINTNRFSLCLRVSSNVEVIGGEGMGIVGEPIDVNSSIDVRRALESKKTRLTNASLVLRLKAADEFLCSVLSSSSGVGSGPLSCSAPVSSRNISVASSTSSSNERITRSKKKSTCDGAANDSSSSSSSSSVSSTSAPSSSSMSSSLASLSFSSSIHSLNKNTKNQMPIGDITKLLPTGNKLVSAATKAPSKMSSSTTPTKEAILLKTNEIFSAVDSNKVTVSDITQSLEKFFKIALDKQQKLVVKKRLKDLLLKKKKKSPRIAAPGSASMPIGDITKLLGPSTDMNNTTNSIRPICSKLRDAALPLLPTQRSCNSSSGRKNNSSQRNATTPPPTAEVSSVTSVDKMQSIFGKVLQCDAKRRNSSQKQLSLAGKDDNGNTRDGGNYNDNSGNIGDDNDVEEAISLANPQTRADQRRKKHDEELKKLKKDFDAEYIIKIANTEYKLEYDVKRVCKIYRKYIDIGLALVKTIEDKKYDDEDDHDNLHDIGEEKEVAYDKDKFTAKNTPLKEKSLKYMRKQLSDLIISNATTCEQVDDVETTLEIYERATTHPVTRSVGNIWLNYTRFTTDAKDWERSNDAFHEALVGNEEGSSKIVQTGCVPLTDEHHGELWDNFLSFSLEWLNKPNLTMEELRELNYVVIPGQTENTENMQDSSLDDACIEGMAVVDYQVVTAKHMNSSASQHNPDKIFEKSTKSPSTGLDAKKNPEKSHNNFTNPPDDEVPREDLSSENKADEKDHDTESDGSEGDSESDHYNIIGISKMLVSQQSQEEGPSQNVSKDMNITNTAVEQSQTSAALVPDEEQNIDVGSIEDVDPEKKSLVDETEKDGSSSEKACLTKGKDSRKVQQNTSTFQVLQETDDLSPSSKVSDDDMDGPSMTCNMAQSMDSGENERTDLVREEGNTSELAEENVEKNQVPSIFYYESICNTKEKKRRPSSTLALIHAKRRKKDRTLRSKDPIVFDIGAWLSKNAKKPKNGARIRSLKQKKL